MFNKGFYCVPCFAYDTAMIRVMTFNIGFCGGWNGLEAGVQAEHLIRDRLHEVVRLIQNADCDIVLLQEVDRKSRRSADVDQVAFIRANAGYSHTEFVTAWKHPWVPYPSLLDFKRQFGPVHAGNMILSRYPILFSRTVELPRRRDKSWVYNWFYLHQVYQEVLLSLPGCSLRVGHVHLDAFDADTRTAQIRAVMNALPSASSVPVILGGDFNAVAYCDETRRYPDDPTMDYCDDLTLSQTQQLGFLDCGVIPGRTLDSAYDFPAEAPNRKLSYVMVTGPLSGTASAIPAILASDHRALVAEINLTAFFDQFA